MKAVADTLAVARSNLIERVSRRAKSRRPYRKAGDDELLALIRRLVDERPTYGYRRIRRLINRQRKADGKPPIGTGKSHPSLALGVQAVKAGRITRPSLPAAAIGSSRSSMHDTRKAP